MNKRARTLSVVLLLSACGLLLPGGAKRHGVAIGQSGFAPAAMSVGVEDTITWTNRDDREHAIVAEDGSFDSSKLPPGSSFSHTFSKAGTYSYGCRFHPREKGTITVGK